MRFSDLLSRLDALGLQRLLFSSCNEIFDPKQRAVQEDGGYMDRPLTDYFIATSHNSYAHANNDSMPSFPPLAPRGMPPLPPLVPRGRYLVGDQFISNSDTRMYEVQLMMGCRCLEIDCWDGTDGEPDVKHGRTLTSAIKFEHVVESINQYAPLLTSLGDTWHPLPVPW